MIRLAALLVLLLAPPAHAQLGPQPVTATGSTTARTLADRARDRANVLDFGATGDGSTSDSAVLTALNTTLSGTGGLIWFPGGRTYRLGTSVASVGMVGYLFDSGTVLTGSGIGAVGDASAINGHQTMALAGYSPATDTGNAHTLVVQRVNAGPSGVAAYERSAIYARFTQGDTSDAVARDGVAFEGQCLLSGTTAGRCWGFDAIASAPNGTDGYLVGLETMVVNNNAAPGAYGTATAKLGLHLLTGGSYDNTAGLLVGAAAGATGKWLDGVLINAAAMTNYAMRLRGASSDLMTLDPSGNLTAQSLVAAGTNTLTVTGSTTGPVKLAAAGTNVGILIQPTGTGALAILAPGSTAYGANAVDLQMLHTTATEVASGTGSFATGANSQSSGQYSVALGANQVADADFSTALGNTAATRGTVGKLALASGAMAGQGDAQAGWSVLRAKTTSTTPTRLTTNGAAVAATNCVVLPNSSIYQLKISIVAIDTASPTTNYGSWEYGSGAPMLAIRGANAGTTALAGTTTAVTSVAGTVAAGAIAVTADTTYGCPNITWTAPNTDAWHVVAKMETVEAY